MMKNDDEPTPYERSLAEMTRFQAQVERTIFSDFNEADHENDLVGESNEPVASLFLLAVVVLIITGLLLMATKTPPAFHAIIS
jgi:uncharacterized iron-regulated membrane protein